MTISPDEGGPGGAPNSYDRIAEDYAAVRTTLDDGERRVLDAGHRVTAVDSSAEMLRRARGNVPAAHLVRADIRVVRFEPASFDAVVSWDAVFHISRTEHEQIYRRCFRWLEPGGRLLLSTGGSEWEGTSEMFGQEFFYSGYDPETMKAILRDIGFRIECWEVDDPSSREHVAAIVTRPSSP